MEKLGNLNNILIIILYLNINKFNNILNINISYFYIYINFKSICLE